MCVFVCVRGGCVCVTVCVYVVCVLLCVLLGWVLNLAAVGPGSPLRCSIPHQSFGLRNDWLRREGGALDDTGGADGKKGGALVHVWGWLLWFGGALRFGRARAEPVPPSLLGLGAFVLCEKNRFVQKR